MLRLNPPQQDAVQHGEGALLVIAGPGSGKTRVITQRIVRLLQENPDLDPQSILALTFTEKAAAEMKRRVREALPELESEPRISTFHAFCYSVLKNRDFDRRLLDRVDVWIFLRRRMAQLRLDHYQKLAEPGAFLHDLNEFFSRCQDDLIEPVDFAAYVGKLQQRFEARRTAAVSSGSSTGSVATLPPDEEGLALEREELEKKKELARVFHASRKLIEGAGYSSLGSLIAETVRLFDREAATLDECRSRFRYVLVDEFQDTNYAQVELLRRLVGTPWNIMAVGDDDQAIYRFRGASHGAFNMFDEAFPGHKTVYLSENYRSTPTILRSAAVVISKNERYQKKPPLSTTNPEGSKLYLLESPDYESEAAWISDEVERLGRRGTKHGEIAILYRAHGHRDALVAEFRRRRIPFSIRGLSILSTSIIRDVTAYLRLVQSPHDNISLTRVLLAPRWRFPEDLALEMRRQAGRDRVSLYSELNAVERSLFSAELKSTGWPNLAFLLAEFRKLSESAPVTALFDRLIARLGLKSKLADRDKAYLVAFRKFLAGWEERNWDAIREADDGLSAVPDRLTPADSAKPTPLAEFMEYFDYFIEAGGTVPAPEPANPANAVQMMTAHAAKGLEYAVVFVTSVARQRFPHREERPVIEFPEELRKGPPTPPDIHLQEERRLFYVALTRARDRLYVSSVGEPGQKLSIFIDDLLSDPLVATRDIERVQISARLPATGERSAEPATRTPAPQSRVANAPGQLGLFAAGELPVEGPATVEIEAWALRPPRLPSGEKLHLSATAIESYKDCPLKFKFTHYLKVPTGPQAALTFGGIMHRAVRYYFKLRQDRMPRREEVEDFYLRSWKGLGFEDSYQEEKYKRAGLDQLRTFVERHNQSTVPPGITLEQSFVLDLGDVELEGRIDQINPLGGVRSGARQGSMTANRTRDLFGVEQHPADPEAAGTKPAPPGLVELIDYKTGRPRSEKDASKSLQLSVYALAAKRELGMEPVKLSFYNLTNNEPVSTIRTTKNLERAEDQIHEVAEKIRELKFDPKPGFGCKYCDFMAICPAHEEG